MAAGTLTTAQKQSMIKRSMDIARLFADAKKAYDGFREEYDAQDYGNSTTGVTDAVMAAYGASSTLTNTDYTNGVSALGTIAASVTTNKTNLFKIAAPPQ